MSEDYISLKWGTLKAWNLTSKKGKELLKRYMDIGASASAMLQNDTTEQKDLLCQMIDECGAETIHLDWDERQQRRCEAIRHGIPRSAQCV